MAEMYSLTGLEGRSMHSKCGEGLALFEGSGGGSFPIFPASGAPAVPRLVATSIQSLPPASRHLPSVSQSQTFLCSSLIRTPATQIFQNDLISRPLIISTKTLFSDKVEVPRLGRQGHHYVG